MFSRFNPAARRVLRTAEQASRNHNHYFIGVGHLMLALLDENDGAIVARLQSLGLSSSELGEATRRAVGTGEDRLWDGILITPRVRRVIVQAEAACPPDAPVTPIALFDALLAERAGLTADVLAALRRRATEGITAWNS